MLPGRSVDGSLGGAPPEGARDRLARLLRVRLTNRWTRRDTRGMTSSRFEGVKTAKVNETVNLVGFLLITDVPG